MGSLVPGLNLILIFVETFKNGWYFYMTQAVTTFIMVSTSSQIINFLVVGSLVIRKLNVYFKSNYDRQRVSIMKALCLIISSLLLLNLRYAL